MNVQPIVYPVGALVRISQICRDPKTGAPGLLPISRATWYRWLKAGHVPAGRKIGGDVIAWPIETVLAVGAAAPSPAPAPEVA